MRLPRILPFWKKEVEETSSQYEELVTKSSGMYICMYVCMYFFNIFTGMLHYISD